VTLFRLHAPQKSKELPLIKKKSGVSAEENSREKTPQEPAKYCFATEAGYLQAAGQYSE